MNKELSHLDDQGKVRMVDVGYKPDSERVAIARGEVMMKSETFSLVKAGNLKKGDVFNTARLAGIMGAKRTAELIPLCHPLLLTHIEVEVVLEPDLPGVVISASVRTTGKTGVEMEALTAVSIAALTVYDMVKAVDKGMHIQNIRLVEKRGGQSGTVKNE